VWMSRSDSFRRLIMLKPRWLCNRKRHKKCADKSAFFMGKSVLASESPVVDWLISLALT
jgi:hypothetical protein